MASVARPDRSAPQIRAATDGDCAALAELLNALGYPCDNDDMHGRLLRMHNDPSQCVLVAEIAGQVVGMLNLGLMYYLPLGAVTCRIIALSVAPASQRMGIGRQLLREAESRARKAGAARIELTTASHRDHAHAFYRACGYGEGALRFIKRLGDA